jgi:hypothetical protein
VVKTGYNSVVGPIVSDWKRNGGETDYSFTIPPNATATIEIELHSAGSTTVNGVAPAKAAGVLAERTDGDRMELTVGSGIYTVRAESPTN